VSSATPPPAPGPEAPPSTPPLLLLLTHRPRALCITLEVRAVPDGALLTAEPGRGPGAPTSHPHTYRWAEGHRTRREPSAPTPPPTPFPPLPLDQGPAVPRGFCDGPGQIVMIQLRLGIRIADHLVELHKDGHLATWLRGGGGGGRGVKHTDGSSQIIRGGPPWRPHRASRPRAHPPVGHGGHRPRGPRRRLRPRPQAPSEIPGDCPHSQGSANERVGARGLTPPVATSFPLRPNPGDFYIPPPPHPVCPT